MPLLPYVTSSPSITLSDVALADTDVACADAIAEVTPAALASLAMVLSRSPLARAVLMVSLTVLSMLSALNESSSKSSVLVCLASSPHREGRATRPLRHASSRDYYDVRVKFTGKVLLRHCGSQNSGQQQSFLC